MKLTKNQTTERTLSDLYRAMDRQHPVSITALKEEKDENGRKTGRLIPTVRTLELFDIKVTAKGDVLLIGMDRETGERRSFRLDRLLSYTTHRTAYTVPREQPATARPVITTPAAFTAYEIARDDRARTASYRPAA